MLRSCSTASVAAQHISLIAIRGPSAPLAASQVMSIVSVRNAPSSAVSTERIFSRSLLVRIGWSTSSRLCVPASCPSRFGRGPIIEVRLITSSSRIGSIGGLVTWAKFCLK
jgi:hypothetical protein